MSERFERPPIGLVLLGTLEIVVRDDLGHYLLILSPRYEPVSGGGGTGVFETGQWTPPYVQYDVPAGSRRTVGSVYEAFRDAVRPKDMAADLNRYVDAWAARLHGASLIDEFMEYKNSWSQPGSMKVYFIRRHRLIVDDCDLRALADSEMRQGFRFLPVDDDPYDRNVSRRECTIHNREHSMYLGRPMATDLAEITSTPAARGKLRSEAITLPRSAFYSEHLGLLFCGDISNYGAACKYVTERMGTLTSDGSEVAEWLRESAISAFTKIFLECGIPHVQTAGDGFICALPTLDANRAELRDMLARFLTAFGRFTAEVDQISQRIADHARARHHSGPPALGTRLAVHFGQYKYGKMGLSSSLTTAFDGASVIDVARLEQGLRGLTKDESTASELGIDGVRHPVALSDQLYGQLGRGRLPALRRLGSWPVLSKEAVQRANLFDLG